MPNPQFLTTLATWLAGEFSNYDQAFNEPAWFVNLRLWHRPLPIRVHGNLAIFAEQANVLIPDQSYRQRVFTLREEDGGFKAQYYGFKQPQHFKGAGMHPQLLNALTLEDLEMLPGCALTIAWDEDGLPGHSPRRFLGRMEAGDRCCFQYDGKVGQVILGFDVQKNQFWSYDKGVDPDTEKPIWGALMGPYTFAKTDDFSSSLPL